MMKQKKDKRLHLLGLGGELFDSVSKAAEFVTKYQKYFCQEDFEKILKKFASMLRRCRVTELRESAKLVLLKPTAKLASF